MVKYFISSHSSLTLSFILDLILLILTSYIICYELVGFHILIIFISSLMMSRVEFSHALQEIPFEVPRVPCLRIYFWCQGAKLIMPFKNFSWNSKGATPLALQASSGYEGKLYVQLQRPLSSRMLPAIVRLMVLGIKESALMRAPQKSSWANPNWDLPPWHHDPQGEGVSTFPA